ncbi:zinc finger protein ZIC 4-like isoform X2 [Tachysurus ichikawai]
MNPLLCACHDASAPIWLHQEVMPPSGLRQLRTSSLAALGHLAFLPTVEGQINGTSYPSRMTRGRNQRPSFGHPGHCCPLVCTWVAWALAWAACIVRSEVKPNCPVYFSRRRD